MGEETDGVVESVSKMQEKIKGLTGVDILTDNGAYKDTYTILKEIGEVWNDLENLDRSALLELMAGKNRANTLAAILGNLDDLEGAYESAMQAENSALRENEKYLDSIQGRIDLFTNSVQSMWMNAISSDFIKFIVDAGTGLINLIDQFGVFQSLIGGFLGFNAIKSIIKLDDFKAIGSWIKDIHKDYDLLAVSGQKVTAELAAQAIHENLLTSSSIKYAVANGLVQESQLATMTTTELLGVSFQALGAKILGAITALGKFLFTTPFGLAIVGITAVVAAYEILITTHEEYLEQLDEQTEKLQTVKSELKDLQSELQTTKDRIAELEELQKNKTLSFVEEEELNRLREQNDELERQQKILQSKEKFERNKQVELALNAIKGDPDEQKVSSYSNNLTSIMQHAAVTGSMDLYTYTPAYAAGLQEPVQSSNKYENALNSLKEAYIELEAAEKTLSETHPMSKNFESASAAVDDAKKKVDTFNTTLYNLYDAWEADYGEVGFITDPITASEEEWNEYYRQHQNYKYRQGLTNGDFSESDVLGYIFGYTGTDLAKAFNESFNSALESGANPSQIIAELLNDTKYTELLNGIAGEFGITADTIIAYFTQVGETIAAELQAAASSVQTYTVLSESVASYKELLAQTEEITTDNTTVTQEYREELLKLVGDTEAVNECFDENNKLVVKDAKALNKLVKESKKNTAQNIKLAKSQARLDYYELYKEMDNLVDGTGKLDGVTIDYIDSLYGQMGALEKTISKYSILEAELLGTANAYDKLAAAQQFDEAFDYGSKAEELVNILRTGLGNNQLGTEAVQVAVEGLIHPSVLEGLETPDEKMDAIYKELTTGTISKLFEIKVNEDGAIESVEMTEKKLKEYINNSDVFNGTWENFTLDPSIDSMEKFMDATKMTKETAFAFFTELEKYDISWLAGNYGTIMDQLMGNNLEYNIYSTTQQLADLEYQLAHGKITAEEYAKSIGAITDRNNATGDWAVANTLAWQESTKALEEYSDQLIEKKKLLDSVTIGADGVARDKDGNIVDATKVQEEINEITGYINELQGNLATLEEPTDIIIQFAKDKLQKDMDAIEQQVGDLAETVHYIFDAEQDKFVISPKLNKDDPNYAEIVKFVELLNKQYTIDTVAGEGMPTTTDQLATIATTLENIVKLLSEKFGLTIDGDGAVKTAEEVKNAIEDIPSHKTSTVTVEYKVGSAPSSKSTVSLDETNTPSISRKPTFAHGTDGAPKTETALVGELGPEMLVRNGRWTTIGNDGAEFTQVKKGDIIFNHKQTQELLKNGHTSGRGRIRGGDSAFAHGTAYAFVKDAVENNGLDTDRSESTRLSAIDIARKAAEESRKAAEESRKAVEAFTESGVFDTSTTGIDTWDNGPATYPKKDDGKSSKEDDVSDEFNEVFDWIEVRLEEINEDLGLKGAQLENAIGSSAQNAIVDEMIDLNRDLYDNLIAGANEYYDYAKGLLDKVPEEYRAAAQDGTIAIEQFVGEVDEKTLEAIQEYREWVQKGADATQQAEETLTEISNLAAQAIQNIEDSYDNQLSKNDNKIDQFDAHNAYMETTTGFESEDIYSAMIKENEEKIKIAEAKRDAMQAELDRRVQAGEIAIDSQEWYDAINAISEVDTEIIELKTDNADLQDSINELHWEKFDLLMKQFEAITDEASNLLDILGTKDAVDELGNWTDEGVTSLGLLAQQMEVAEMQAQQYKEEIEYLNENWKDLGYTQEEYIDKLEELKSGQYDAINAYHDAKDAIVDLNKERVDAIKNGIEKEIDAYSELIKKKQEALDADKDAHDWQESVNKQNKTISDIERQIAALSGDTSMSARAKRAQLEAELLEAKAELDEMYYDRTVEKQKEALDQELENFQEKKENEIEDWEKYLENVELVVADSLAMVQENTQTVLETLTILGQEFALTITEALTNPWKAGETAIQDYGVVLNMSLTQLASLFGMTVDEFAAKLDLTTEGLVSKLGITVAEMAESLGLTEEQLATKLGLTTADLSGKMGLTIQQFATSIGYTIPELAGKLGTTTSGLVGNLNMTMTQFAGRLGLTVEQLAGKFGLTTKGLANKLGQTYQQLTNPFGMSMSATVDALKRLENEYQKILDNINAESIKTVSQVNHAMSQYQAATTKSSSTQKTVTPQQKPVTIGSKINAGNARIYDDSYGGGAGTQYYSKDPIYTIIGENNGYWLVRYHKLSSGYTGWFKKSDVKAYAKGTTGVKEDQLALIDELGEELQLVPGKNGRLEYLKKGTSVIPADLSANLMEWGKLDPSVMLDQNRPRIGVSPSIVNNTTEIHIDASVGELLHVEHLDGNNPAEITKIVDKAWDKRMKELNAQVRRYTR